MSAWRPLPIAIAAALWFATSAGQMLLRPAAAVVWHDLPAAAAAGPRASECFEAWGLRCRWYGRGGADRQRRPDACGPAALRAVLRARGPCPTQELLWSICRLPGGGTTLGRLAWAARRFGQPCEVRWTDDPEHLPLPAILHLRRGHFVVLHGCAAGRAWVLDPACGEICVPGSELRRRASGATLVFASRALGPGPQDIFREEERP